MIDHTVRPDMLVSGRTIVLVLSLIGWFLFCLVQIVRIA